MCLFLLAFQSIFIMASWDMFLSLLALYTCWACMIIASIFMSHNVDLVFLSEALWCADDICLYFTQQRMICYYILKISTFNIVIYCHCMQYVSHWSRFYFVWCHHVVMDSSDAREIVIQNLYFSFDLRIAEMCQHAGFVRHLTNLGIP